MAQQQISNSHQPGLAHHVNQGRAWLEISAQGANTAALSYSAFELRFAIERLAIHYWATLLSRRPEEHEMREIESFKRIERRIYELAGHQLDIDGHFEFMRIPLEALKIEVLLITPKIGSLAKYWQECSELCHIAWPLACSVTELRNAAYSSLSVIAEELTVQVQSKSKALPNSATGILLEPPRKPMSWMRSHVLAFGRVLSIRMAENHTFWVSQCRCRLLSSNVIFFSNE